MTIEFNFSPRWRLALDLEEQDNYNWVKIRGNLYSDKKELFTAKGIEQFSDALSSANGFYALVKHRPNEVMAAVDHVRSIPLFYSQRGQTLILSDDAEWVRSQVDDNEMDPIAREEFLLAGYVTGSDTLYSHVKQLQAGECLAATYDAGRIAITKRRYYRFQHVEPAHYNAAVLGEELKEITTGIVQRLIQHAAGRQIVLPLSGGYDSRLIAALLKQSGYKNIICYTYGRFDSKETKYSRQIAEALGFAWLFVPYSVESWHREWASPAAVAYRKLASNHTSLPHVQDWLAIKHLVSEGLIENNAVVVPGHTGDFISGGHIPSVVFEKPILYENDLLGALINAHLSNSPSREIKFLKDGLLNNRLRERIGEKFDNTPVGFANLYEAWEWQERQAKYIVNSVRVYEQFELDWWLPLWDIEFLHFWEKAPLIIRKERIWFKAWIKKIYAAVASEDLSSALGNSADRSIPVRGGVYVVKKIFPKFVIRKIYRSYYIHLYNRHPLAFNGLVDKRSLESSMRAGYNIIGVYSQLFLDGRWGE